MSRIPHISRCHVAHDVENHRIILTHIHNDKEYVLMEDLPMNFEKQGYHARKEIMRGVVHKIQERLGILLKEDNAWQESPQS